MSDVKAKHLLLTLLPIVGGLVTGFAPSARALPTNLGFEDGFNGWTVTGGILASVVTSHTGDSSDTPPIYSPVEGTHFASLQAGAEVGVYTITSEEFYLDAGTLVSGYAAFDYRDYQPYNDKAKVQILDSVTMNLVATPWSEYGYGPAHDANHWDGPWTPWSWTALSAGNYKLQLMVYNEGGYGYPSFALFDAHRVPEASSTLALMGLAALGLVTFRRKLA